MPGIALQIRKETFDCYSKLNMVNLSETTCSNLINFIKNERMNKAIERANSYF